MTTSRLEPRTDGYYENILNEPPLRIRPNLLNPNFITSNALFVQENETIEERLASRDEKLNINDDAPERGDFPYPQWFMEQHNTYQDLGNLQNTMLKYPSVAEVPTNIIRSQSVMNAPNEGGITKDDINSLRNLINSISKSV